MPLWKVQVGDKFYQMESDEPPTDGEAQSAAEEFDMAQVKAHPPSLSTRPQFGGLQVPSSLQNVDPMLREHPDIIQSSTSDWNKPNAPRAPRMRDDLIGMPHLPVWDEHQTDPRAGEEMAPPTALQRFINETSKAPISLAPIVRGESGRLEQPGSWGGVEEDEWGNVSPTGIQIGNPIVKHIPESWLKELGAGTYNAAAGLVNFMGSPQGLALMAVGAPELMSGLDAPVAIREAWAVAAKGGDVRPLVEAMRTPAGKAVSSYFAYDMAKNVPDALQSGDDAARKGDFFGAAQGYINAGSSLIMSAAAGRHALTRSHDALNAKSKELMGSAFEEFNKSRKEGETNGKESNEGVLQAPGLRTSEGGTKGKAGQVILVKALGESDAEYLARIKHYNDTGEIVPSRAAPADPTSAETEAKPEVPEDVAAAFAEDKSGGAPVGESGPLVEPQGPPTKRQQALYDARELVFNAAYAGETAPTREVILQHAGVDMFTKSQWGKIWSEAKKANRQRQNEQQGLLKAKPEDTETSPFAATQKSKTQASGPLRASEILDLRELNRKLNDTGELEPEEQARLDRYKERRAESPGKLDEPHQAVVDEVAKELGVKVRVGDPAEFEGSNYGDRALADTSNNEIILDPKLSELDLNHLTPDQAREAIRSLLVHEANHLATPEGAGERYWRDLPSWQKAIAKRIANLPEGMSDEMMGREVISRHMQRLANMTPVEVAMELGKRRMEKATLEALDRIIQGTRENLLRTKASKRQLAELDKIQNGIREGIKIYNSQQESANKRPEPEIEDFVSRIMAGQKFMTEDANRIGLKVRSIADLDALANARLEGVALQKKLLADAEKLTDRDARDEMVNRGWQLHPQIPREAIETAVNAGSHVEGEGMVGGPLGPRPLDWREHPEVAAWLKANGKKLNIVLPDELEMSANKRNQPALSAAEEKHLAEMPLSVQIDYQRILSRPQNLEGFYHSIDSEWSELRRSGGPIEGKLEEARTLVRHAELQSDSLEAKADALWDEYGGAPGKGWNLLHKAEDSSMPAKIWEQVSDLQKGYIELQNLADEIRDWANKELTGGGYEPGQQDLPFPSNENRGKQWMSANRRPEPPEMDPDLKKAVVGWLTRREMRELSPDQEAEVQYSNDAMAQQYGIKDWADVIDDFEDAIFNIAARRESEWGLSAEHTAALKKYFEDAKGTQHDRLSLIDGQISGTKYLINEARSKLDMLLTMEKMGGNTPKQFLERSKKVYESNIKMLEEDARDFRELKSELGGETQSFSANKRGKNLNYDNPPEDHNEFLSHAEALWGKIVAMTPEDADIEGRKLSEMMDKRINQIRNELTDAGYTINEEGERITYTRPVEEPPKSDLEEAEMESLNAESDGHANMLVGELEELIQQEYQQREGVEKAIRRKLISIRLNDNLDRQGGGFSANRRYGMTKRGKKIVEDMAKLRALQAEAEKSGVRESAMGFTPFTPESLSSLGTKVMQAGFPSYDAFLKEVREAHGPIGPELEQSDTMFTAFYDAAVKHLENANGSEIERIVDEMKLRREVYGSYSSKISASKFIEGAAKYIGQKEAEKLGFQNTRVSREGKIADQPVKEVGTEVVRRRAEARYQQMVKLAEKIERDARKMVSDQKDLEDDRAVQDRINRNQGNPVVHDESEKKADSDVYFKVSQARARAAKLREDADRMMSDASRGEVALTPTEKWETKEVEVRGVNAKGEPISYKKKVRVRVGETGAESSTHSQSTLFGDLDKTPEISLGTSSKASSEVVGSAQKMRARAIAAILGRISSESGKRESLAAKAVVPDELAWGEEGQNAIIALDPNSMGDLDTFGWTISRGGRSDATTKRTIAGGRRLARRKGQLETVSKRITVLYDQATGKVHLVTTYRTGAGDVRLVNPLGGTMSLKEMPKRYVPIYSMMRSRPLKGFHQVFDSRTDFSEKFLKEALDRKQQSDLSSEGTESIAQHLYEIPAGNESIEGEGGYVIGPNADLVRVAQDTALRYGNELTEAEARKAYMEFSQIHTEEQAMDMIAGLRDRIDKRKLTPPDYLLISAIKKAARAVDERFGDDYTPEQKAQQTLKELHEIATIATSEQAFIRASSAAFGKKPSRLVERPTTPTAERRAVATPPTGAVGATRAGARELTMRERVSPTVVRDAQGKPIYNPAAQPPPVTEVGGGLQVEPPKKGELRMPRRTPRTVRWSSTGEGKGPPIAESPGEREPYVNPELRAQRTQQRIAAIDEANRVKAAAMAARKAAEPKVEKPKGKQTAFWPEDERSANKRYLERTKADKAIDLLRNVGSFYDEWMADRIGRNGGELSKQAAEGFKVMIDRTKEAYGSLTPVLDPARTLAGRPGSGASWLHDTIKVTKDAAISRTVKALEDAIKVPKGVQNLVTAAKAANYAIAKLLEPVIEGFKASGAFQRNLTALGYDIIRGGPNERLWDVWIDGIVAANKDRVVYVKHPTEGYAYGVPVTRELVEQHFKQWKEKLDKPGAYYETVEQINQDMRRMYPETITHVRDATGWHEVIHANLFGYLESTAQRASHIRAFREQFPNTKEGRAALDDMVTGVSAELKPRYVDDLHALLRTMQGHPTDNYSNLGFFSTSNIGGQAFKIINQTVGNLLAKAVLTGQVPTQFGETLSGSTPVFFGAKNTIRGMARVRQLYAEMEKQGMVNRVMYDFSWDNNAKVRSTARIAANATSKLFMENALNEFQEAVAASTAHVVADRISKGELTSWEKSMLPETFKIMGFTKAEAGLMMRGDVELLNRFKRQAATFLTSGNRGISESSKLGSNRLFNSLFRFQSYPMMKMNQFRRVAVNFAEALQSGTPTEKLAAGRALGRFIGGNTMQGALTVAFTTLVMRGVFGVDIWKHEAQDDPKEFLFQSFMASIGGPLYLLTVGAKDAGIRGMAQQGGRLIFPWAMGREMLDATYGVGRYANKGGFERLAEFIKSKSPGLRGVESALALAGVSMPDRDMDTAINAFYRWRRKEKGWKNEETVLKEDERAEFKRKLAKAVDALNRGSDEFQDLLFDAADANDEGLAGVKKSLSSRVLLKTPDGRPLSEEDKDALRKHIGDRAYNMLEDYDFMMKLAANGIQTEPPTPQ